AGANDLEARLRAALETLGSSSQTAGHLLAPVLGPAHPPASGHTVAELETLARRLTDVGEYRRRARSFLRFVSPGFYGARADYQRYLEAGYRETGGEGETGEHLTAAVRDVRAALAVCAESFGPNAPADAAVGEVSEWAAMLLPGMDRFGSLVAMAAVLGRLEPLEMREAFATLLADPATHRQLGAVVPATVYGAWARQLAAGELARTPDQHDRLVESFARLDAEMIGWGRGNVLYTVRDGRPRSANHPSMAALVKYAHAKRRPALRTMLGNSREAVQTLKPCLLMSPLAAAQYLCHGDGRTYRFDAVIVDEASMIPTPDLVVALSLAPQAIIVGDSKQMPPTSFFSKEISAATDDGDEVTFESILDEAAPLLPSTMLRAHYRSRDEALIAFSNAYFYDGRLIAFPDAWGVRPDSGVQFQFVSDGVYGRGKSRANPAEAKRVIDLLREELAHGPSGRQLSVTAMSLAQQSEILEQLNAAAALDPLVRGWVESGGLVRNLETVQGDESDVMFLSVGYGKDADGRMFMNFGPLGQEKGERRLNVAITRARWKTVLVTSLHAGDIDPARASSTGALRLRDYLDYAERGPAALPAIETPASSSGMGLFPAVLLEVLRGQGLDCEARVGVGGYQVDIGVRHPGDRERFVLAVECDGPAYYAAPSARDRELGRRAALERMGWNVHRVFAPAWLRNPDAELERLLARYRQALL
ncbi:MAG TPA: AAA domain-containing protein, partial [Tepidiformaceae bacterium]|nr:AAA domain-containing protein [Tepidiformaceae bacterium]